MCTIKPIPGPEAFDYSAFRGKHLHTKAPYAIIQLAYYGRSSDKADLHRHFLRKDIKNV